MSTVELCRLCTKVADQIKHEKLFDQNHHKLLQQIEELIGLRLKNAKRLPQHICKLCEEQTLVAYAFRAQCIQAQQHFATLNGKTNKPRKCKLKDQVAAEVPIEEVVLNELNPVKVENFEREDCTIQLPSQPLGEQALYRLEHTIFESKPRAAKDEDDFYDSLNPLDEEDLFATDGEGVTIEPETAEHSLSPETQIIPHEDLYAIVGDDIANELETVEQSLPTETELTSNEKLYAADEKNVAIELETAEHSLIPETELKPRKKKKSYYIKKDKNNKDKSVVREEKPYICDQCGKIFKGYSVLESHLRRHTGDKKFKCEICADSFFLNADLKRHIRKHNGELPYPCSFCDRRFLDRGTARKHERIHRNERPYVCQQCGKGFNVAHTLRNHMLAHTNERAFSCKMCNVTFKRKTHLVTHYRSLTHKENEAKYQMNISNIIQVI